MAMAFVIIVTARVRTGGDSAMRGNITVSITKFMSGWIKYKDLARVGFVVKKSGKLMPPGQLSARAVDFAVFR